MARKSFLKGAVILGAAGLFVKILGAVFRILLTNMLDRDGMALYTPAYYVYSFFLILATAGIPVAISRMVSEHVSFGRFGEAHRVFRVSSYLMVVIGAVSFIVVFFGADTFAGLMKLEESALAMKCIAPSLLFVPLMASYRGYFQGMQEMKPTAFSQIIEQVFRLIIGLILTHATLKGAIHIAASNHVFSIKAQGAAGGTLGAVAGSVGGLLVILIIYACKKKSIRMRVEKEGAASRESAKTILKKVAIIALPITIGAAIMPIVNMIDASIVSRRLIDAGFTVDGAEGMYGLLTGFAGSLINLPQVLTQAIAMSLVPLIAAAHKHKETAYLQQNVSTGLRTALIMGLPCAMGLFVLAKPILLLYPKAQESAIETVPCLMVLSVGVVFLSTVQTLTGVLQGIGKQMIPVRNLCIGVLVKLVLTWTLTAIPSMNIMGAAAGTVCAYVIASILNIIAVRKYTGTKFDFKVILIRPFISSGIMGVCAWGSFQILNMLMGGSRIAAISTILIAVVIYVVMIFVTKAVTKEDVAKMPAGDKLTKLLDKFLK